MSMQLPQTPLAQWESSAAYHNSTAIQFTPDAEMSLQKLKRSFSELSNQDSPKNAGLFLAWRQRVLEEKITMLEFQRQQYKDSFKLGLLEDKQHCENLEKADNDEMEKAEDELNWILRQGQFVREDIQDQSAQAIENAYVAELHNSFRLSSEEGLKEASKKPKKFGELSETIWARSKQLPPKLGQTLGASRLGDGFAETL